MKFKNSMVCKDVETFNLNAEKVNTHVPKSGDVALFEVIAIGKHKRVQSDEIRNKMIFPGDKVLLAFGNRYATAQLHGYVPTTPQEEYHILGQGGVCGVVDSFHTKFSQTGPTRLKMIGYATDSNGEVINTKYLNTNHVATLPVSDKKSKIILSIGGAMDSGKTTTAAYFCRGLKRAGQKVSFIKLTGTAYSKDIDFVKDCGADNSYDFSHFGFPSTYMESEASLLELFEHLMKTASQDQPDYVVIEIADGILQRETNMLLKSSLMDHVHGVLYSDSTSIGILSGLDNLRQLGIEPFGVCGSFVASPLMIDEVKDRTTVSIFGLNELSDESILDEIKSYKLQNSYAQSNVKLAV